MYDFDILINTLFGTYFIVFLIIGLYFLVFIIVFIGIGRKLGDIRDSLEEISKNSGK